MQKLILFFSVILCFTAFKAADKIFTGKIIYKYSFTDLQGNDLNSKLITYLGNGQEYFINAQNYKSTRQGKLQQLYNAETNTYFYFSAENEAQKLDAGKPTSQKFTVTHLPLTEKIAGYTCKAIKIETDETITIYFYSPEIKTDVKTFARHQFGEWNKYLEATNGALALKYTMTSQKQGFIWTSTATEITKMNLSSGDFTLPENVKLKE